MAALALLGGGMGFGGGLLKKAFSYMLLGPVSFLLGGMNFKDMLIIPLIVPMLQPIFGQITGMFGGMFGGGQPANGGMQ